MMRLLRAVSWLRWRLLLRQLPGDRGGTLEQFGRLGALLVKVMLALVLLPLTAGLTVFAFWAGWSLARGTAQQELVLGIVRGVLAFSTLMVAVGAFTQALQGARVAVERLLLLPVSHRQLFLLTVLGSLADPFLVFFLPALLLLPAGLAAGGAPGAALATLVAGVALVAVLCTFLAAASLGLQLLMRGRRRAELVTLVLMLVLTGLGFAPLALEQRADRQREARATVEKAEEGHGRDERQAAPSWEPWRPPVWTRALPSELYGATLRSGLEGRLALLPLAALALTAGALGATGHAAYRRLLDAPSGGSARRSAADAPLPRFALPGVPPPVAAVALAQVKGVLRTVRGKMAVYPGFLIALLLYFVLFRDLAGRLPAADRLPPGPLLLLFGAALIYLMLQGVLSNQFAIDGPGLTLQWLSPLSGRQLVAGKLLAGALLMGLALAPLVVAALVIARGGSPWSWLAALTGCLAAYLPAAPLGIFASALFPRAADLSRLGQEGQPHPLATLMCMMLFPLCLLPPVGLFLLAHLGWGRPFLALAAVAGWLLAAALLAALLARAAAALLENRRERLLLALAGG